MAYQNVPVSDGYQVVQQIATFAATLGWTVHRDEDRPANNNFRIITISASGTGPYLTLVGDTSTIYVNGHRGISTGSDWNSQPDQFYEGSTTDCAVRIRVNPIVSVHLFGALTPDPYIYVAIEKEPGYYRHLVMGHMVKFGTALGGMFWDNSETDFSWDSHEVFNKIPLAHINNYITAPRKGGVDCQDRSGNPAWLGLAPTSHSHFKGGHWGTELFSTHLASPVQFNSRTPLVTPMIQIDTGANITPFGTPPNLRYMSMEYYEAGDELIIGPDTWKVFPLIRKGPGANNSSQTQPGDEGSGNYGIAYLKD